MNLIQQLESIARGVPTVDIRDLFSKHELAKASNIIRTYPSEEHAKLIRESIVEPKMDLLNEKLGQESDARYLAYALINLLCHTA